MQGRKKYLKFVAFVPAIVLVGGFVGYRAGAFELFSKPEPQPQPESQPAAAPQPAPETKPTLMPGSKYVHIDLSPPAGTTSTEPTPPGAAPPNTTAPAKPPTFIYGSKSAPVVPVAPAAPTPTQP